MKRRTFRGPASSADNGPKTVGQIIGQMLRSNSPFSCAYLEYLGRAYPNTEPCIDLKLLTVKPGRMEIGEMKSGMITRDADDHYLFIENAGKGKVPAPIFRNPGLFEGKCINVRKRADGTLYVTLKRPTYFGIDGFSWFCRKAAEELLSVAETFGR